MLPSVGVVSWRVMIVAVAHQVWLEGFCFLFCWLLLLPYYFLSFLSSPLLPSS